MWGQFHTKMFKMSILMFITYTKLLPCVPWAFESICHKYCSILCIWQECGASWDEPTCKFPRGSGSPRKVELTRCLGSRKVATHIDGLVHKHWRYNRLALSWSVLTSFRKTFVSTIALYITDFISSFVWVSGWNCNGNQPFLTFCKIYLPMYEFMWYVSDRLRGATFKASFQYDYETDFIS